MSCKDTLVCNSDEDLVYWIRKAEAGDVDAMFNVATWLRFGLGVPVDQKLSFVWLEKAAAFGHSPSLGALHYYGKGGRASDHHEAFKCWTIAVGEGNIPSMHSLAYLYMHGQGVEKDDVKARELLEKATEYEFPPAMGNLAMMYERGEAGIKADEWKAMRLFQRASALGDCTAMANLALIYEEGVGEDRECRDVLKARALYEKAAAMGETFAIVQLAQLCQSGNRGLGKPDIPRAFSLLREGVRLGGKDAKFMLAVWLLESPENESSYVEAIECLGDIIDDYPHATEPAYAMFEWIVNPEESYYQTAGPIADVANPLKFSIPTRALLLRTFHERVPNWTDCLEVEKDFRTQVTLDNCKPEHVAAMLIECGLCRNRDGVTVLAELHRTKETIHCFIPESDYQQWEGLEAEVRETEDAMRDVFGQLGADLTEEEAMRILAEHRARQTSNIESFNALADKRRCSEGVRKEKFEGELKTLMRPLWVALERAVWVYNRMVAAKTAFFLGTLSRERVSQEAGDNLAEGCLLPMLPPEVVLYILTYVEDLPAFVSVSGEGDEPDETL